MAEPFVGLPDTETGGRCSYSADLDHPRCSAAAALHIAVESSWGEAGVVALATCEPHASLARAAGKHLDEHAFGPDCAESAACWVVMPDTGSAPLVQYGHAGRHHGIGTPDCPRELHHHHDERCEPPSSDNGSNSSGGI